MKEIFHSELKAKISVDENEKVRDIIHSGEHWRSSKQDPLEVAIDYLKNVGPNLKVSTNLLENINIMVSFDAPKDQKIQYQPINKRNFLILLP